MALTGTDKKDIRRKAFQVGSLNWEADFSDYTTAFAGFGFEYPENESWINLPTGQSADTSAVYAFPRSAEGAPFVGTSGWKLKEC